LSPYFFGVLFSNFNFISQFFKNWYVDFFLIKFDYQYLKKNSVFINCFFCFLLLFFSAQ
jgi:hypothetical protein